MIYNNGKKIEKKERNHNKFILIYKVICFLLIGIILFQGSQRLFKPKWFPYDDSYDAGKMRGYLNEKKDSIDILICGASHASRGIYPMELYEKYGFKSYNLSTSGQPIEATYYLLKEAFLTQNRSNNRHLFLKFRSNPRVGIGQFRENLSVNRRS